MQLMIDILVETPAALRLASRFLSDHAALREAVDTSKAPMVPPATVPPATVDAHTHVDFHSADLARAQKDMTPIPVPPVPLVPPPPNMMPPDTTASTVPVAAVPVVPIASNVLPLPLTVPVMNGPDEFDVSGVPFDGRIHQKSRNKKKDGTWKIQKGLDPAVVSAVMQELAPRIRSNTLVTNVPTTNTPIVNAPVSLPSPAQSGSNQSIPAPPIPTPTPAVVSPPVPNPADVFGKTPLPVGAPAPVPLPPAVPQTQTKTQVTPQGQTQGQAETPPLNPFRALVRKITDARTAGRITQEEVTAALAEAGAPSLQLLNNMTHLVSRVEDNIDLILATR